MQNSPVPTTHHARPWEWSLLRKLPFGGRMLVKFPEFGGHLYLYPAEAISELIWREGFEPNVRAFLKDLLRPGMVFVDAGANLGFYTVLAGMLVGQNGRVFSFEPSRREFKRAQKNVLLNDLQNVILKRAALSDRPGTLSLNVCVGVHGAFNSLGRVTHPWAEESVSHVEQVESTTLDDLVQAYSLQKIDVLKIDVEGAEALVLQGGKKLLSQDDAPLIVCELCDMTAKGLGSSAKDVVALLVSFGYQILSLRNYTGAGLLSYVQEHGGTEYEEVLAVKPRGLNLLEQSQVRFARNIAVSSTIAHVTHHGDREAMSPPRISVVTATFNQSAYLEQTINSILGQNYPNLEYIVIDDGSTDETPNILRKYVDRLTYSASRPNKGQYETITEGFEHSTGEIMGWLSSDDLHLPWCFSVVAEIFSSYPEVEWLTSVYSLGINERGEAVTLTDLKGFSRDFFYAGGNLPDGGGIGITCIQHQSTFWRRSLWERAGARLDAQYNLAADFELWARFYQHAELYGIAIPLASFRFQAHQRTWLYPQQYAQQCKVILRKYHGKPVGKLANWYRRRLKWRMPARFRWDYAMKVFAHPGRGGGWRLINLSRL